LYKYCWEPDPSDPFLFGGCIMLYPHAAHDFLFDFHVLVWIAPRPWTAGGPFSQRRFCGEKDQSQLPDRRGVGIAECQPCPLLGNYGHISFLFGETNPRRCSNSIETNIWESTMTGWYLFLFHPFFFRPHWHLILGYPVCGPGNSGHPSLISTMFRLGTWTDPSLGTPQIFTKIRMPFGK
jgi:hypothetical protein